MANGNQTEVYLSEQVIVLFSCALSLLGSSLIIFTYIIWSDLRTTPRRLLVYLSVADWLSAGSYAYGVSRVFRSDSVDCVVQGAISTFANTSSFFWTVAIAVYLYFFIVRSSQRVADSLVLSFHFVSWGVPLAITIAAVCLNKIGYDASEVSVGWCWVRIHAPDRVLWMLLTGKIWEFLAYLTLPILYILIKRHIHIAGIGNTLQGAANCTMFVLLTRPIRTRLCTALCCCCTKCRAEVHHSNEAPHSLLPEQDASNQREEDGSGRVRTDR
ncbi:G-protein coupled receptor 157 isoform X2 [Acanthochromis polyacanthus]|uniref:G-protein coupled receptor 157 isoform X2 n=1 Tax=Acanthochromis polyacanthus TaxID=80966 RepID=UPI002234B093|nr:G-protein coupled receptor 157 isoform X2 [Acanthochromis polyacanthus]